MGQRDTEFTAFVVERRQVLLRTAYLLCGSWTQAEDVVQIALSKLYVAWPRVQPASGAYAYARQIVARTAVDEWRRPWRREVVAGNEPHGKRSQPLVGDRAPVGATQDNRVPAISRV